MPIRPLAEMTWEEARDAQRKAWIALLPIGAVEAHGPHLPIRTDGIIAEAWAREAAARLQACGMRQVVLPTVDYTSASFAESFPGTLSVGYETVTRLVVEVAGHPVLRRVLAHGGDHDPIGDSSDPYWTRHAAYTMGYDLPWPDQYESVSRYTARFAFDFGATE